MLHLYNKYLIITVIITTMMCNIYIYIYIYMIVLLTFIIIFIKEKKTSLHVQITIEQRTVLYKVRLLVCNDNFL